MELIFLLPVYGEKVPEGRMRGGGMRGGNEQKVTRARELRHVENEAEEKLWHELRGRRLNGYKFVRQLRIGPYFADFACREKNLVVEVDGSQHAERRSDVYRDETMNRNGWSVLRIWHADVLKHRREVLDTILAALDGKLAEKMIAPDVKFLPSTILEER
ncbi:very-short-patch-repair endonuclease [Mesorhizobium sp. BE184]|nr:very-short-patch-repair endonuclease [Mesorhizobium sp. BE184]